ncbi:hypothetical protein LTS00_009338 [Friedmanniomyces endolithicus]|nr:hypothetical protein LTS00_009338 [Friedmanniomyces endolithicus]
MSSSPIIAVVGGINMDLVHETERMPILGESMDALSLLTVPGGKGANTAISTYKAGHNNPASTQTGSDRRASVSKKELEIRVCMNGAVGDDAYGKTLLKKLEDHGIDTTGVHTFEGAQSGTCVVIVEKDTGESRNLGILGANGQYEPHEPERIECLAGKAGKSGTKPDLIVTHLGVPRETVEQILETASNAGVDTILNPSAPLYLVSEVYPAVTHLIMNESEAAILTPKPYEAFKDPKTREECAKHFIDLGAKNVIITLGEKGAYYRTESGQKGHVAAEKNVRVRDTTGAGDSFIGAYAVDYVRQKHRGEKFDIVQAITFASKAAARTIEAIGAQESLPWADEMERKY